VGAPPTPPPVIETVPLEAAAAAALQAPTREWQRSPLFPVRLPDGRCGFVVGWLIVPGEYRERTERLVVALASYVNPERLGRPDTGRMLADVAATVLRSQAVLVEVPAAGLRPVLDAFPRPAYARDSGGYCVCLTSAAGRGAV
jgi:hypothetical protein